MNEYPQYFRKANRCIKRENVVAGVEIYIPEPGQYLPLIHAIVICHSSDRFDEMVKDMEVTTEEVYESYLGTFFQSSEINRKIFNSHRQRKFDSRATNI